MDSRKATSDAARKAAEEIVTERMASDLLFAFFGDLPTPQAVQKQRAQMVADGAAFIQRAIDSETVALREENTRMKAHLRSSHKCYTFEEGDPDHGF